MPRPGSSMRTRDRTGFHRGRAGPFGLGTVPLLPGTHCPRGPFPLRREKTSTAAVPCLARWLRQKSIVHISGKRRSPLTSILADKRNQERPCRLSGPKNEPANVAPRARAVAVAWFVPSRRYLPPRQATGAGRDSRSRCERIPFVMHWAVASSAGGHSRNEYGSASLRANWNQEKSRKPEHNNQCNDGI
jgi:hypothetical protein